MPDNNKQKDYVTTSQAARLLSVSPDTVLKWVKAGKVKSYRTLGGHFRIPVSELDILHVGHPPITPVRVPAAKSLVHQYCWEYLAGGDEIKTECKECITFRSRARRCYELKDLPGGMGCLNLLCDTECSECEYYKVVSGQATNILILSDGKKLLGDMHRLDDTRGLHIRFAENEYEAAVLIQQFRPDYMVVDCSFGKKRTAQICNNLFSDIRIPVARIILSSRTKNVQNYCDKEVFGWIRRPFVIEQLRECILGVPKLEDES